MNQLASWIDIIEFGQLNLHMKLKLNEKLAKYGFNTYEFFQKPILLHALEKFSNLAQDSCLSPGAWFYRLRNQNFMSFLFHTAAGDPIHNPI